MWNYRKRYMLSLMLAPILPPTTWFAPRLTGKGPFSDVYSVMANWGANHGVLTIGHVGADFITLAAMLRIPVYAQRGRREDLIALPHGRRTVWTAKARIIAPARTMARCISVKHQAIA